MVFEKAGGVQIYDILCLAAHGKAREHNTTLHLLFVDLRKAYNSVPREALRQVLRKYGIPPPLVNGMKAAVTIDDATTPEIEVTNGLRQGCTIAPTLL